MSLPLFLSKIRNYVHNQGITMLKIGQRSHGTRLKQNDKFVVILFVFTTPFFRCVWPIGYLTQRREWVRLERFSVGKCCISVTAGVVVVSVSLAAIVRITFIVIRITNLFDVVDGFLDRSLMNAAMRFG